MKKARPKSAKGARSATKAKKADADQRARFIAKARELGCDETGESFEQTFEKIVPPKRAARKSK